MPRWARSQTACAPCLANIRSVDARSLRLALSTAQPILRQELAYRLINSGPFLTAKPAVLAARNRQQLVWDILLRQRFSQTNGVLVGNCRISISLNGENRRKPRPH